MEVVAAKEGIVFGIWKLPYRGLERGHEGWGWCGYFVSRKRLYLQITLYPAQEHSICKSGDESSYLELLYKHEESTSKVRHLHMYMTGEAMKSPVMASK